MLYTKYFKEIIMISAMIAACNCQYGKEQSIDGVI
jgi:hypothetical protein